MSSGKQRGQHSAEINRVIRRRACHNRFPHKWSYCGSPMANIFSRPGHNPRRFSRATKGRQREILSIVQKRLSHCRTARRIGRHPVPVVMPAPTQNVAARRGRSRLVDRRTELRRKIVAGNVVERVTSI